MEQLTDWMNANAGKTALLFAIIIVTTVISRVLRRPLRRILERSQAPNVTIILNIVRVVIWLIATAAILQLVFGINPTTLITALGVGGLALSLGLTETFSNAFAGFELMLGKVIQPGDLVRIGDATGTVHDITWRHTVVIDREGNRMVIPNSVLNTTSLEQLTDEIEARVCVPFTAHGGWDVRDLEREYLEAVRKATADVAHPDYGPELRITGFSPYGIEGEIFVHGKPGIPYPTVLDLASRAIASSDSLEQQAAIPTAVTTEIKRHNDEHAQ